MHHFEVFDNIPLSSFARLLSAIGRFLIVEFVPKSYFQVQRLMKTRQDVFTEYRQEAFERDFPRYFAIRGRVEIVLCSSVLFLMEVIP